jgi:hypothetical protein
MKVEKRNNHLIWIYVDKLEDVDEIKNLFFFISTKTLRPDKVVIIPPSGVHYDFDFSLWDIMPKEEAIAQINQSFERLKERYEK